MDDPLDPQRMEALRTLHGLEKLGQGAPPTVTSVAQDKAKQGSSQDKA